MRYSSQVKSISYLKANAAEVLAQLTVQRQPLVITQNWGATLILSGRTTSMMAGGEESKAA
jgi:PHD/YefM family antitoxin component YafN of YafNO toxin-antitoxin module